MEWSQDGVFEDRATLGVVNRRLEVPRFTKRQTKKLLRIKTESLSLTYRGDGPFNPENLSVSFKIKESRDGWAVLDESERHVFTQEGWVAERREGTKPGV